ncbi:MAG TPA: hypothetical protein ENN99_13080 [Chloroflexi bacterium]|nr:hypothetical protein [Chloroflexota bacterium]
MILMLQVVAAVVTIITGIISLFWPRSVTGFTGSSPSGPRGVTEIRAVLGGFFVALGMAPLVLKAPAAYQMLVVAVVRTVSMIVDRSVVSSNLISAAVEIVLGVILVL